MVVVVVVIVSESWCRRAPRISANVCDDKLRTRRFVKHGDVVGVCERVSDSSLTRDRLAIHVVFDCCC